MQRWRSAWLPTSALAQAVSFWRTWLFFCLLLALAAAQAQPINATQVLRLSQAEFVLHEAATPPTQGWSAVQLPEFFTQQPPPADRIGWYRLTFELQAPPAQPLVLLVQRAVTTAEFRLNGSLLNAGVRFPQGDGPAGTKMTNWPHWLILPPGLFRAGQNELLVRLRGDGVVAPWISGISIGPPEALRGEFLLRDIPQRLVPQALSVLLAASLLFGLRIWWRQRPRLQGLMVLTAALWLAQLLLYQFPDLPLPARTMTASILALWVAFHWALLSLLWRLSGSPGRWFGPLLAVGSVVPLTVALVVVVVEPSQTVLGLLMLPTTLLRLITTLLLLRWAWRERSWQATALAGAELLWFAGPVQTMLVATRALPPDPFMLTPASGLPLVVVLVVLAAQQVVQQLAQSERRREAAVQVERQRMMLDMHDGIGAQLVTAVRLARRDDVPRETVAQVAQEALHDLRLMINALDGNGQPLPTLLGQLRQRIEPRLLALGQRLDWHIDALPSMPPLAPTQAMDVARLVQEAVNNAARHAGASTIGVALRAVANGCELRISDNGHGMPAALASDGSFSKDSSKDSANPGGTGYGTGRGLAGMHRRAARVGGTLHFLPGDGGHGTVVLLRLPGAGTAG